MKNITISLIILSIITIGSLIKLSSVSREVTMQRKLIFAMEETQEQHQKILVGFGDLAQQQLELNKLFSEAMK